jgi:HSP20 family protein
MKFGLTRRGPSGLSRWDPFEEIRQTQEHLNKLFRVVSPFGGWCSDYHTSKDKGRRKAEDHDRVNDHSSFFIPNIIICGIS